MAVISCLHESFLGTEQDVCSRGLNSEVDGDLGVGFPVGAGGTREATGGTDQGETTEPAPRSRRCQCSSGVPDRSPGSPKGNRCFQRRESVDCQPVIHPSASPGSVDQPGVSQDLEVIRQQVWRNVDLIKQLADTALTVSEFGEDAQPNGIS